MRHQPGIADNNGTEMLTVLSISPREEDRMALESAVSHSRWILVTADCRSAAFRILRRHDISVVLCERNLNPGTWTDVLDHLIALPKIIPLIVMSELADDRLWAEALNLGAWDVLSKPLDRAEVLRSLDVAWQHWHGQNRVMKAAS